MYRKRKKFPNVRNVTAAILVTGAISIIGAIGLYGYYNGKNTEPNQTRVEQESDSNVAESYPETDSTNKTESTDESVPRIPAEEVETESIDESVPKIPAEEVETESIDESVPETVAEEVETESIDESVPETAAEEKETTDEIETDASTVDETESTDEIETDAPTVDETESTDEIETDASTVDETESTDEIETDASTVDETESTDEIVTDASTVDETEKQAEKTGKEKKDVKERAATLADFYASTGAYTPTYGVYSTEAMERIIKIMNGDYTVKNSAEAKVNMDYLSDYYAATLNSEGYMNKVNEYNLGDGDSITSIDYLDLTDTVLANQDYKAYIVVDCFDSLHQKIMKSNSKEETSKLCNDFLNCLANLTYGKGFTIDGVNYTIDDIKGQDNNGLASILVQCIFELVPFTYDIKEVEYIDKDGNVATVPTYELMNQFNIDGSFYNDWERNLMSSMTK